MSPNVSETKRRYFSSIDLNCFLKVHRIATSFRSLAFYVAPPPPFRPDKLGTLFSFALSLQKLKGTVFYSNASALYTRTLNTGF